MQDFQGPGFFVQLPDQTVDASTYCFVFPAYGDFPPNLTIRCEEHPEEFELGAYVAEQRQALADSAENFSLINEISSKHDFWTYVVSIVEWGADDNRVRQKRTYVHVPGEPPRLYTLTGTDLAANFEVSDAVFNQVIRSLKPVVDPPA